MDAKRRESEEHLMCLMNFLVDLVEDAKGTSHSDERYQDAEGLALKVFYHAASALYLFRSTTLSDFPGRRISFFDPASFAVLTRAALETFLTFYLVFVHPDSDEEFEFRYFSWKRHGLLDRQDFPVFTQQGRASQSRGAEIVEEYEERLRGNPIIQRLLSQHGDRLAKETWRMDMSPRIRRLSWPDIGQMAGLSALLSRHAYSYLCGWAHSGSLGVGQLWQARTADSQRMLTDANFTLLKVIVANMCFACGQFLPAARPRLEQDDRVRLARFWKEIGQELEINDGKMGP